ncbi:hypothetical protein C2R22_23155 (plasmid) [Salinigranum rubrum]|uniref:Uncharacterized protein n=1 Tax=Salinigranum rubrum TaxID=755307 RepID=A0A2I8VR98_9EURY|nr:hypothetical protein [Salinigranum rubrum]AUV84437.1 hypothetical protein C2R22_23155 [Salinigranum rubrum]
MSKDVPMASHLLSSKVFGVSARKLAESLGPPLIVPIILYAIGLPLLVTAPFVILGGIAGIIIYTRTPEGQRPIRFAAAMARHFRGRTEYLWKPPEAGDHDIASREPFEGWITERPDPAASESESVSENEGGNESYRSDTVDRELTVNTDSDADAGPASEWPAATTTLGETYND